LSIRRETVEPSEEEFYEKYEFDPNPYQGVEHIDYSHTGFHKKRNVGGICVGAAAIQVIEEGPAEEKALELQQQYRSLSEKNESTYSTNKEEYYSIIFNLFRNFILNDFSSKGKNIKKHNATFTYLKPEDSIDLIKKSIAARKDESLPGFRYGQVFFIAYSFTDCTGHAVRFDVYPDIDTCSFYDANFGKDTGPCDKIVELYKQNIFKKYNQGKERVKWNYTRNPLDYYFRQEAECRHGYSIFNLKYTYPTKEIIPPFSIVEEVRMLNLTYHEKEPSTQKSMAL
jgi:hypothetical protein